MNGFILLICEFYIFLYYFTYLENSVFLCLNYSRLSVICTQILQIDYRTCRTPLVIDYGIP
jgi:hypothetical protein